MAGLIWRPTNGVRKPQHSTAQPCLRLPFCAPSVAARGPFAGLLNLHTDCPVLSVSCSELRGPGKPKASDKIKKIFNLKAATLAWSGASAEAVQASDEGAANAGGGVTSSMTSLAAMGGGGGKGKGK